MFPTGRSWARSRVAPGRPYRQSGRWPDRRPDRRPARIIVLLLGCFVAACAGTTPPTFNPNGACVTDGRVPGAYPDLEARVPKTLVGQPPGQLDSGRNCTAANLGTFAGHGLNEVRFAGGLWADGAQSGITLAVFAAPNLLADWVAEWYEASARAARQTGSIKLSKPLIAGRQANRMDLVNGESSQTVITWPAGPALASPFGAVVNVVIAGDEPESRIQEAVAAFP